MDSLVNARIDGDNTEDVLQSSSHNNFLIVDDEGIIQYKSEKFSLCPGEEKLNSINELNSDPSLALVLQGMKLNKTKTLSIELIVYLVNNSQVKDCTVRINKITLFNKQLFLLLFEENKEYKVFENKINTFQSALEKANIPVLIADDNYRTKYVTQNFEKVVVVEKNIEELYDKEIFDVFDKYLNAGDEANLLNALDSKSVWTKVINIQHQEGTKSYFDLKVTPIFDSALEKWNFIFSVYDITDYIVKGRSLAKEESKLRGIINNISDTLFVLKKKDNKFSFAIGNNNFFNYFQIDKRSFDPDKFKSYVGTSIWNTVLRSIDYIENKNLRSTVFNHHDKNDNYYEFSLSLVKHAFDEERYYIIIFRDITAKYKYKKQLEIAYQKEKDLNKLKTLILHNMSHELRTPANAIMGYSEIIEDSIQTKDYETVNQISHYLKDVLAKLIDLFTNIIELSDVETGNYHLEIVRLNCNQVVQSVYNKMLETAEKKKINFLLSLNERGLFIKTDWIKFEKVLIALVDNAIKFTKEGKVELLTKLSTTNEVEIKVIDTGEGMEESKIKNMLEPFQQEEEFYTRSKEGSGLGLTIAQKLTAVLGGKLSIESKKNHGTIATITFPAVSPKPTVEL
jgi:signal transduction histidine kinase/PAS domain-containing protein